MLIPPRKSREGPLMLVNTRTGGAVATAVELALDSESRNRGLLGRDAMPADAAILIAPCWAIHMFFMRFAIDAIFVAKDGTVAAIRSDLKPWRIAAAFGAHAVIEMAAGAAARHDIRAGDRLQLVSAIKSPDGRVAT